MIRTGDPKGVLNRDIPPEGKNSSPWEHLDLGEPMLYETSGILTTDGHRETVQLPERDTWISRIALARLHKARRPEFADHPNGDRS